MKSIKTCAVCGEPVERGTGKHYSGRLVHKKCFKMAKLMWYRYARYTKQKHKK